MTDNTINNDMTMGGVTGTLLAGRYRVVRQLGQGGMGSVWLAEDTKLDGFKVAIKMLPSVLVNNKRAYAQVKAEALVSLKLSHSNIATVRAFEEEGGNPFLVMDYIDGQTLDDYLAEKGKLTEDEAIRLLKPVAAALDYAHAQGVVHRDVKPGNVMIRRDGTPFVLDFGIAREIQETMTRVTGKLSSGTLLYMSPEQLRGSIPTPAQDIYSFAAMAYECLTGNPPFARGQVEYQIEHVEPEPLGPQFANCGTGVMAGLEKSPENRPASCVAVLTPSRERVGSRSTRTSAAQRFGEGRQPVREGGKRRWIVVGLIAALVLAGAGAYHYVSAKNAEHRRLNGQLGISGSSACVLTNFLSQIELVTELKMVRREGLIDALGLKEGDDLNKIDFAERRKVVLSKIPNLRTLSITRDRQDRIVIAAEERMPLVRLGVAGSRQMTGRVADGEGVVFGWHRGTQSLPVILESESCLAGRGCRLSGRSFAALSLIKACGEAEFADIRILEVDTSKMDFLLVTLDNSSRIKMAWNGMDQGGALAEQDLRKRLGMLVKAMASKVVAGKVMWNLVNADHVYVDTNDPALDKMDVFAGKENESAADDEEGLEKEVSDLRAACLAAKKAAEDTEASEFAAKEMAAALRLLADADKAASREFPQTHPRNDQLVAKLFSKDVAPEGYKKFGNGYVRLENWDEISRRSGYAERLASFCAPDPRYIFMLKDNGDDTYSPLYVIRPTGVRITGDDLVIASEADKKELYQNARKTFGLAQQLAIETSKPKVTIRAILKGQEVNATVTSGLKDKTRKTPVTVDLSGLGIGSECEFELAYVRDGTAYMGKGRHTVKKGSFALSVELSDDVAEMPLRLKAGDVKTVTLPGGAKMEMVWCPPGSFMMGSPEMEEGRSGIETQHKVTLTRGFWMGKYEVTQRQWESVMGENPSSFRGVDRPVERVSWDDCQKFLNKAGNGLRLPTDAEWEYACRAGSVTPYAGTGRLDEMGWYADNSGGVTHSVGKKKPNAWGLYDMHGNVQEWCQDWLANLPGNDVKDPRGPVSGEYRIVRGGCCDFFARFCRSACRYGQKPFIGHNFMGFRVACHGGNQQAEPTEQDASATQKKWLQSAE